MERLLKDKEAANVLQISTKTLERYRAAGTGPAYVRIGGFIRYRMEDVISWIVTHRCVPVLSTSKLDVRGGFDEPSLCPVRPPTRSLTDLLHAT